MKSLSLAPERFEKCHNAIELYITVALAGLAAQDKRVRGQHP